MFFPRRIILMLECHLRALDADVNLSGNDILLSNSSLDRRFGKPPPSTSSLSAKNLDDVITMCLC